MAKYQYVVLTKATPGQEEAFHDWYDAQHLPDCVRVPGVVSARRYRLLNAVGAAGPEDFEYCSLAIYEMETDDPVAVGRQMGAMAGSPAMPLTDALDRAASVKIVAVAAGEASGGKGNETG
jgi:hypothetical protein